MVHDKTCKILGRYCWTHKLPTESGLPGWGRKGHSDTFVRRGPWGGAVHDKVGNQIGYFGFTEAIIWANGDVDRPKDAYPCEICKNKRCEHPVLDRKDYKEIAGPSYWEWMGQNAKRNEETGEKIESVFANPDTVQGV